MKKIFAIALALVMVLSMASAFALNNCSANFTWPCDTKVNFCGRGTVEIVPMVKVNNGCGGYDWQMNTCAGAVAGEKIYFAVKLNVEANADAHANADPVKPQKAYWWDGAALTVTGVKDVVTIDNGGNYNVTMDSLAMNRIDWDATTAKSYYRTNDRNVWVDVTDDDLDMNKVVWSATVADNAKASKVKICANLESKDDGIGTWYYGDYKVEVAVNSLKVTKTKTNETFVYTIAGNTETVKASSPEFQAEVNKMFNLNGCTLGTCLTEKNIQKNFGWDTDGKLKNCFNWSANATAIVNPECKVEIPKTGDASVIAYAVMALVAAAGAMGLKK